LWTGLIGVGVKRSEDRSSAAADDQRPMSAWGGGTRMGPYGPGAK